VPRTVLISNAYTPLVLEAESVRRLAELVLEAEGAPNELEVSIAFVDDAAIAALNERHLGHEGPTDVLAFPMQEGPHAKPVGEACPELLGDVVISVERAVSYCREHGGEPLEELALYLVHGLLHLLGYEDVGGPKHSRMRAREQALLRQAAEAGVVLRWRLVHTDRSGRS